MKYTRNSLRMDERRVVSVVRLGASRRNDGGAVDANGADPAPQEIHQCRTEAGRRERVQGWIQCGIHRHHEHNEPATPKERFNSKLNIGMKQ